MLSYELPIDCLVQIGWTTFVLRKFDVSDSVCGEEELAVCLSVCLWNIFASKKDKLDTLKI